MMPNFASKIKPPKSVRKLERRLRAGEHLRCACCLNWVDARGTAVLGWYSPADGAQPIALILCHKCILLYGDREAGARIEAYLTGGVTHG